MKKYFFISLLIVALELVSTKQNAIAWSDNSTHPKITDAATEQSILRASKYLKDNLGFNGGLEEVIFSGADIKKFLSDGARTEDTGILNPGRTSSCSRGLNHFYDPSKSVLNPYAGLDDWTAGIYHWTGHPNLLWAKGPEWACYSSIESPPDEKSSSCNDFSWHKAREAFVCLGCSRASVSIFFTDNKIQEMVVS